MASVQKGEDKEKTNEEANEGVGLGTAKTDVEGEMQCPRNEKNKAK